MITDKISNIDKYIQIPCMAKDFIKNIKSDLQTGKIVLSNDIYVNIETYVTKSLDEAKFETHNKYADIQILAKGIENIYYTVKSDLTTCIAYNDEKDIEFYSDDIKAYPHVMLDGANFVLFLPGEAHAPQVCVNNQISEVKKIVIKIKM